MCLCDGSLLNLQLHCNKNSICGHFGSDLDNIGLLCIDICYCWLHFCSCNVFNVFKRQASMPNNCWSIDNVCTFNSAASCRCCYNTYKVLYLVHELIFSNN